MTSYKRSLILEAIRQCNDFIAKEGPRDQSLRPAEMQQHLDYCITHRIKLLAMLEVAN